MPTAGVAQKTLTFSTQAQSRLRQSSYFRDRAVVTASPQFFPQLNIPVRRTAPTRSNPQSTPARSVSDCFPQLAESKSQRRQTRALVAQIQPKTGFSQTNPGKY